jgi:membrane associated rhomboid family serine protease
MSYSYRSTGPGEFYRPRFFGGFSLFPPVIKGLIVSNVVVWVLLDVLLAPFVLEGVPVFRILESSLALWPIGPSFWPWQIVTYMFLHGGFFHLFFNMLALWMFGMELENTWGSRKFLIFYLLCGIGGALANLAITPLLGQAAPTVGATGAVFGVLIGFAMLFPNRLIYLYFLIPVKAKYLIAVWIGLELFFGVTGSSEGVAHFAHLGGVAVGLVYMAIDLDIVPLREWLIRFRGEDAKPFAGGEPVGGRTDVRDARFFDITTGKHIDRDQRVTQEVVDEILDKISRGGYQSLTEDEKRILNEASKRIH